MTLSAKLTVNFQAVLQGSGDLGTPNAPVQLSHEINLASGSGAGQAQKIFADNRTLSGSASENLDFAGALTDPLGQPLTFATIKGFIFRAASTNAQDLIIGGAASNGFVGFFGDATDTMAVPPGGILVLIAPGTGKTVTASTGDLLKVLAGAGGANYDVIAVGT